LKIIHFRIFNVLHEDVWKKMGTQITKSDVYTKIPAIHDELPDHIVYDHLNVIVKDNVSNRIGTTAWGT
jgi:hypothetical protein